MSEFDPKALTFSEIEKEQLAFIDSKPDSQVWRDRYLHSSGTIEMDLNSIVISHLIRKILFERRETYLSEAKKNSSLIAIANVVGYSTKRAVNNRIRLRIIPSVTMSINKFQEVGLLKDVSLLSTGIYNLVKDVPMNIDLIIGNLKSASITAQSSDLDIFRFIDQNVTEDIRIYITNGSITSEVEFSSKIEDLEKDMFVVITNSFGSVDLFYLNETTGRYFYNAGSVIELEYIEAINNMEYLLDSSQVTFFYGSFLNEVSSPTANDTQTLTSYQDIESNISIRIKAPLYSETQSKIRGRDDFEKNLLIINSSLIDTKGRDISPQEVELTYLKKDKTLLTSTEKTALLESLNEFANYGVFLKTIKDPIEVFYNFSIKLKNYLGADISEVYSNLNEILFYEHNGDLPPIEENRTGFRSMKLKNLVDLDQIEHELVRIQNKKTKVNPIQIARVELNIGTRVNNTTYTRGSFVKLPFDNGFIYECVKSGTSASIQPVFTTSINSLIIEGIETWQSQNNYSIGDKVLASSNTPYIFECIQAGESSLNEPSWNLSTALNASTIDNDVIWKAVLPLDVNDFLIWKCLSPDTRKLQLSWNEYCTLGGVVTWL